MNLSLPELFQDFIKYKQSVLAKNSLARYRKTHSFLVRECFEINLNEIDLELATRLRDRLLKKVGPNTVKDYFTCLTSCFDWAIQRNLIADNPFNTLKKTIKSTENKPSNYFEKEEVGKIFESADSGIPKYASFIKFLLLTGCRPGEGIALKWNDVNFKNKLITIDESYDGNFKATKTNKSRRFRMTKKLETLLRLVPISSSDVVFSIDEKPIDYRLFTRKWDKFLLSIGLPAYSPYSCRHTFITLACRELGQASIADIANQVGNSSAMIFAHYFHKNPDKEIEFDF